jgi:hypothetical protein
MQLPACSPFPFVQSDALYDTHLVNVPRWQASDVRHPPFETKCAEKRGQRRRPSGMRMLPRTVCFQLATRCLLRRISPSAPTAIARMAAAFAKGRGVALLSVSCACSARIGYHPSALSPLRHRPSRVDAADAVPRHVKASAVMADGVGVKGTGLTKVAVVDPSSYEEQLHAKIVGLQSMFAEFHLPEVEVFRSAPSHYR